MGRSGKEYIQDDEYNVTVTARGNTERIGSMTYDTAKQLDIPCGEAEIERLKSMTASLSWVTRQVQPALSHRASRRQAHANQATTFDCRVCTRVLAYAKETSSVRNRFCFTGFSWGDTMVCRMTDARLRKEVKDTRGGKQ